MNLVKFIAGCLLSLPVQANAATYLFTQSGYQEGATANGSFSGNDLNNDGAINSLSGELTGFSLSFSGNSIVSAFSLDTSDLIGLYYGPAAFSIITAGVPQFLLNVGPGGSCTPVCSVLITPTGVDFAAQSPSVSVVPEPSTWASMLLGFSMVAGVARYRRRRTAVTYA